MNDTQAAVLRALGAAEGMFVSGERLGEAAGVSRAAVAKAADGCRRLGYGIESTPHRGHRLVSRPDLLLPIEVEHGLGTASLGRVVHWFPSLPSTQSVARRLAEEGAPHGTLVVAEQQTAGRGRTGAAYWCPAGGLWATLVLRGPLPAAAAPLASLAAGVALSQAIGAVAGITAEIKWPNDLLAGGRKLAGILTELFAEDGEVEYLLLGAGVNVNVDLAACPDGLAAKVTSVTAEAGRPVSRRQLLQAYLLRLEALYAALVDGRPDVVTAAWRAQPNCLGQTVRARAGDRTVEGVAEALGDGGALLVRTAGGLVQVLGHPIVVLEAVAGAAPPGAAP